MARVLGYVPSSRLGPRPALAAAAAAAAAVAGLCFAALEGPGGAAVVAGAVLVCLAGAPMVARLRTDPLDAVGIFGAVTVATFGVASLAWLGTPPVPGPALDRQQIAVALVLVAAALVAAGIGAWAVAGRPLRPAPAVTRTSWPSWRVLLLAYLVCLGAIAVGVETGSYGFLSTASASARSSLLSLVGSQAAVVILATAVSYLATGDQRLRRLLAGMLVVQLGVGFVVGIKGESILAFVFVVLAMIAAGRRLPWKQVAAGVAVVLLVIVPANEAFRSAAREVGTTGLSGALRAGLDPSRLRPDHTLPAAVRYPFARFRNIDHLALIVRDTPSVFAYGNGSNYYVLPLMVVIPRRFWDDKPVLDGSAQFSRTYWEIPPSIHTSQPLTQIGDLYRNFAVAGVVVGMLLWGAVIGGWQRLRAARPTPRMTALYLWSIPAAVAYVESDLPNLVATLARTLPLAAVVTWLLLGGAAQPPGYQVVLSRLGRGRRRAAGAHVVEPSPG
jgi:hypothetical protein